ncbi:hypothetical protein BGZ52_013399, partial [Haplosporangium bisporale]
PVVRRQQWQAEHVPHPNSVPASEISQHRRGSGPEGTATVCDQSVHSCRLAVLAGQTDFFGQVVPAATQDLRNVPGAAGVVAILLCIDSSWWAG